MTVALKQGSVVTEIGPGGLFHSLLSTVAVHLEGGQWGSRFPHIMNELYQGSLSEANADEAYGEMQKIKTGLSSLGPGNVVWDIENIAKNPPWGKDVGPHVKSMANYYVTTTGRNLVDELLDNLESLKEFGGSLDIISYDGVPKF
ncbi:hypothetical protein F2P45_33910 [Massilia sp. CCM 8733]|uniref:Uncharacterized protein n=1 Tax=Massilia mucilaginosa TaxID=2609282 RepID=A0ABX0P3M5_9BURK|nr:Imm70 family immunity protein [Massilia mucilaginosa]NHZ93953.1 hypothetical protein [Massilia mucilaginosa]